MEDMVLPMLDVYWVNGPRHGVKSLLSSKDGRYPDQLFDRPPAEGGKPEYEHRGGGWYHYIQPEAG